jgi:hypothetical protein
MPITSHRFYTSQACSHEAVDPVPAVDSGGVPPGRGRPHAAAQRTAQGLSLTGTGLAPRKGVTIRAELCFVVEPWRVDLGVGSHLSERVVRHDKGLRIGDV